MTPSQTWSGNLKAGEMNGVGGQGLVSKPVGSDKWLLVAGIRMTRSLSREQTVNSKN